MKFSCSQQNLSYGINQVQKAVSTRNTLPVLLGIKIKAQGDRITLNATDLELSIECQIYGEIEEEGEVVLPAKYFVDIVRNLPGTVISFEMNRENYYVKMKAGKSEFNLHGLSAEEFPADSIQIPDGGFLIPADHFRDSLFQTQFAVSHDESRPVFTGILIEQKDGKIVFVATDGYRLAVKYSDIAIQGNISSVILPGKAAGEIFRLSSGKDFDDIRMDITDNRLTVQFPDTVLTSRLIEGQFPNYKQIIPKSHPINIELDREEFLHTIERVGLITKEGPNIVRIHVTKDQKMIITARSPEIGDTYDEIDIGFVDAEIKIAFNVKYLTDVLKVLSDEKIVFSLTEELKPASIRPLDSTNYEYIVLPVRLPQ